MPGGDRTGPMGGGPRTGRALGYCSGYDAPGFTHPAPGQGLGRGGGFGRGLGAGRGGGRGPGTGWGRGWGRGMGWGSGWGWGRGMGWGRGGGWSAPADIAPPAPGDTREALTRRLDALTAELGAVREQLDRLPGDPDQEGTS